MTIFKNTCARIICNHTLDNEKRNLKGIKLNLIKLNIIISTESRSVCLGHDMFLSPDKAYC